MSAVRSIISARCTEIVLAPTIGSKRIPKHPARNAFMIDIWWSRIGFYGAKLDSMISCEKRLTRPSTETLSPYHGKIAIHTYEEWSDDSTTSANRILMSAADMMYGCRMSRSGGRSISLNGFAETCDTAGYWYCSSNQSWVASPKRTSDDSEKVVQLCRWFLIQLFLLDFAATNLIAVLEITT